MWISLIWTPKGEYGGIIVWQTTIIDILRCFEILLLLTCCATIVKVSSIVKIVKIMPSASIVFRDGNADADICINFRIIRQYRTISSDICWIYPTYASMRIAKKIRMAIPTCVWYFIKKCLAFHKKVRFWFPGQFLQTDGFISNAKCKRQIERKAWRRGCLCVRHWSTGLLFFFKKKLFQLSNKSQAHLVTGVHEQSYLAHVAAYAGCLRRESLGCPTSGASWHNLWGLLPNWFDPELFPLKTYVRIFRLLRQMP